MFYLNKKRREENIMNGKYKQTKNGEFITSDWDQDRKEWRKVKMVHNLTKEQKQNISEVELLALKITELIKKKAHLKSAGEAQETRADLKDYLKAIRKASIRLENEMYGYRYDFIELEEGEEN